MDAVFAVWLATRPQVVQDLCMQYPPGRYRVKPGAPYKMSCAGAEGWIYSYCEDGNVGLVVDVFPAEARLWYLSLKVEHKRDELPDDPPPLKVCVDPKWLEPI